MLLLISTASAQARPMRAMASTPAAETIMHGRNAQYVVRFDGPVDHTQSRLVILHEGHVVQVLRPLLDSAADVLFASAPAPEPGRYVLHWIVKSVPDQDATIRPSSLICPLTLALRVCPSISLAIMVKVWFC